MRNIILVHGGITCYNYASCFFGISRKTQKKHYLLHNSYLLFVLKYLKTIFLYLILDLNWFIFVYLYNKWNNWFPSRRKRTRACYLGLSIWGINLSNYKLKLDFPHLLLSIPFFLQKLYLEKTNINRAYFFLNFWKK